jgi:hypothetical protein
MLQYPLTVHQEKILNQLFARPDTKKVGTVKEKNKEKRPLVKNGKVVKERARQKADKLEGGKEKQNRRPWRP